MKTHEEQLAFAEENSRLTNLVGEIADAMEALTLPEDKDKFLDLLYEQKRTFDALRKLGEEYMGEEEYKKFAN